MAELINEKIGKLNLKDASLITISKVLTEEGLKRIVGNSTFKSGISKLVIAYLLDRFSNSKVLNLVSTGMVIDGLEDIFYQVKKISFGKLTSSSTFETI